MWVSVFPRLYYLLATLSGLQVASRASVTPPPPPFISGSPDMAATSLARLLYVLSKYRGIAVQRHKSRIHILSLHKEISKLLTLKTSFEDTYIYTYMNVHYCNTRWESNGNSHNFIYTFSCYLLPLLSPVFLSSPCILSNDTSRPMFNAISHE
jgi:hypothetical protein